MIEGTRTIQLEKMLRDRDISYAICITDTTSMSTPLTPIRTRSAKSRYRTSKVSYMDWKNYHTLETVNAFLGDLESEFPSICTVDSIAKSVEGRDIKMLKISNSDTKNVGVWIDGGTHAREWITVSAATYLADYIARNFDKLPKYMTDKDWYIVPVLNPDGYVYSHNSDRMWRKNRARYMGLSVGVDLNRNFATSYSRALGDTSLDDPASLNYRGPEPFSEPETAAVKDFILYSTTPFKIFLTFHSYSEVISFPWCNSTEPCPDYVRLLEGAAAMAKGIFEKSGRIYKVGAFKDTMYQASGTSIDWSYGVANILFSYLIELRSKEHKFLLPKEEILDNCEEVMRGVMALVRYTENYQCNNCVVINSKRCF